MFEGLPNQDKSFTLTLFMPNTSYQALTDREALLSFFNENFRDSIDLIGEEKLVSDYFSNKALSLVSVKCSPYHVKDKAVILGDAAHAMVPFYGQGMNCGMEDCRVLDEAFDRNGDDISKALEDYSKQRNPDAEAMCDLAMYNYIEMRDLVNKKSFLLRKKLDNLLHWMFPSWWVPLYTSVTFTRMRYHHCVSNKAWQDEALQKISTIVGVSGLLAVFLLARHQTSSVAVTEFFSKYMEDLEKLLKF